MLKLGRKLAARNLYSSISFANDKRNNPSEVLFRNQEWMLSYPAVANANDLHETWNHGEPVDCLQGLTPLLSTSVTSIAQRFFSYLFQQLVER
jgi:hypothetical protein